MSTRNNVCGLPRVGSGYRHIALTLARGSSQAAEGDVVQRAHLPLHSALVYRLASRFPFCLSSHAERKLVVSCMNCGACTTV